MAELKLGLLAWRGDSTPREARARLASGFSRLRLFDAAALVAPLGSEAAEYAKFCRRIERQANEYYRRSLIATETPTELMRAYIHAAHDLWPRLHWQGVVAAFYPAAADVELGR